MKTILVTFLLFFSLSSSSQKGNFIPDYKPMKSNEYRYSKSRLDDYYLELKFNAYYGIEKSKMNLVQQIRSLKEDKNDIERFKKQNSKQVFKTYSFVNSFEFKKINLIRNHKYNRFQFDKVSFSPKIDYKFQFRTL